MSTRSTFWEMNNFTGSTIIYFMAKCETAQGGRVFYEAVNKIITQS